MSVRVRYAPSPTGYQHIGGIRTALFNYFFARSCGGSFILRIEDTDRERYFDGALDDLYRVLDWLGIDYDEGPEKPGDYGPYLQSQRCQIYLDYVQQLLDQGYAYHCYCSLERLERIRKIQRSSGMPPGYDKRCRQLGEKEREIFKGECKNPVIRFKIPENGKIVVHDEIFGDVARECKDINPDPVILKSDGYPTYHLANVVDDHLMGITHVLRAQEWMPSASLHSLLYRAFGWEMPKICHLPMVLGQDGQKLSKRHGATHVWEFRKNGYLAEAIINYVSLLGWSLDDSTEIFSCEELCKVFSLKRLNKAPAVFDFKKLNWFNGFYLRRLTSQRFLELILPFLKKSGVVADILDEEVKNILVKVIPLVQERVRFLVDAIDLLRFFFIRPQGYDPLSAIPKNVNVQIVLETLVSIRVILEDGLHKGEEKLDKLFRKKAEELGINLRCFLQPLRVALTGSMVSPPLVGSLLVLGKEESLLRIESLEMALR